MSFLSELDSLIAKRKEEQPAGSYTTELFLGGENTIVKKLGEELAELIRAACHDDKGEIVYESADLIYHLLVLLHSKGLSLQDVEKELARRHS